MNGTLWQYKYLLFHPDTTAHPLTSPASATDASAGRSAPLPAPQLAPTTEFPEPWLLLLPSRANVVAAAATQLGCEEHPTTASTSAGPAPTCASRHCKLGGTSGPDLRRTRRPSRAHKPQAALNLPGYPLPSLDPVPGCRHALPILDFVTQPVHRI